MVFDHVVELIQLSPRPIILHMLQTLLVLDSKDDAHDESMGSETKLEERETLETKSVSGTTSVMVEDHPIAAQADESEVEGQWN